MGIKQSPARWLDRRLYPEYMDSWDDALLRQRILQRLKATDHILDLGAGAGIVADMRFHGLAAKVVGVDLDPRVLANPHLDEAFIADASRLPLPDASVDMVISDNVLEHLVSPEKAFSEVTRILRPGGIFMFKTPNRWHYMPIIASLTPLWFHRFVKRGRLGGDDVFPTQYKANSERRVRQLAAIAGLVVTKIEHVEGRPEYLRFNPVAYLIGAAYERLVNASAKLEWARILLIGELRKPS